MNSVILCGFLSAEPIKKQVNNREVVVFQIGVDDISEGQKQRQYLHTVLAWDEIGEEVWNSCGIGDSIRVEGKLTSRAVEGQKYLKVEIVATAAGLSTLVKPESRIPAAASGLIAAAGMYPAVEPNSAREEAENGPQEIEQE